MAKSYILSDKTREEVLKLLNGNGNEKDGRTFDNIAATFRVIQSKSESSDSNISFGGSLAIFRARVNEDFIRKVNSQGIVWKIKGNKQTDLFHKISVKPLPPKNLETSNIKTDEKLPVKFDMVKEGESKIIKTISDNTSQVVVSEKTDTVNNINYVPEEIEKDLSGLLYNVNILENRLNRYERKLNKIVKNRYHEKEEISNKLDDIINCFKSLKELLILLGTESYEKEKNPNEKEDTDK